MKDKATAMGLDSGYAYNRITHQYEKIGLKQLFLVNLFYKFNYNYYYFLIK